jgi:hypothetical protein
MPTLALHIDCGFYADVMKYPPLRSIVPAPLNGP